MLSDRNGRILLSGGMKTNRTKLFIVACLLFWAFVTASLSVYFVQNPFASEFEAVKAIPRALIDYVLEP
jgi:hypothetical protein